MQRMSSQRSVVSFLVVLVAGAFSLSCSSSFLASPVEAQIPKSGTATGHSGWLSAGGTKKVGEKRLYGVGVYWGVSFNDENKGFMHQMAWQCPAVSDIMDGMIQAKGNCTLTDTNGDKIYASWTAKGVVDRELVGNVDMSSGTGKYTGIQGTWEFHCWGVGPDGQLYCHQQANYTLP